MSRRSKDKITEIYFVQAEEGGPIKIGLAADPIKRLKSLQSSSPQRLMLLGVLTGTKTVERNLHQRFSAFRLHGEWFTPASDLLKFISGTARPATQRGLARQLRRTEGPASEIRKYFKPFFRKCLEPWVGPDKAWSSVSLAKKIGVDTRTVEGWRTGKRAPTTTHLLRVFGALPLEFSTRFFAPDGFTIRHREAS